MTILIVSPNDVTRRSLTGLLQQSGFEVKEAATATGALPLALEKPGLILIDYAPSDLNGLELSYRLKAEPKTAAIPLLPFFSGQNTLENPTENASSLLTCPEHTPALLTAVKTLTRLELPQNRIEGFLEAAPDAVVISNQEGSIVQVNAETNRLFGYHSGELLGKSIEMLIPERFRSKHIEHRAEYIASPRTRPMGTSLDLYGLRNNGDEFPADISISPLANEEGFVIASIIRDVTGHRQLQDSLRASNQKLEEAFQSLDRQFRIIGEIQESLLPSLVPTTQTMDLAVYYKPAEDAGGDYYDFFPLPDGQLGIFLGDVSGHGTPAAVIMAITHCIAHTRPSQLKPPGSVLEYLNFHLANKYTKRIVGFVTGFYGIYDPLHRTLMYSSGGHLPPLLKRSDGTVLALAKVINAPLGVDEDRKYGEYTEQLNPGDQVMFYTDGLTETFNQDKEAFGLERLKSVLENCSFQGHALLNEVIREVEAFAEGQPADDDRTVIVGSIC
jgi:PAS domain S-box-containing protein